MDDAGTVTLSPATLMRSQVPDRFVVSRAPDSSGVAQVEGAELHHMREVLRLTPNAQVSLLDPAGFEHSGTIERYEPDRAVIRIDGTRAPRAEARIIVAAAIVKGPRMDLLVEKASELGACAMWPLICARSVVRAPGYERISRWRRLALAAAKQSRSPRQTEVAEPLEFADLIRSVPADTLAVICTPGCEPLSEVLRRLRPGAILIAIGPEGDFDDLERNAATDAGFVAVGLGPNRLRSETAAIAAVSIAAELLHTVG